MTSTPVVSIVSPSYETAGFLPFLIESLVAQTERRWELIVIDDGSNDSTSTVVRRYAADDERIRLAANDVNIGLGRARNHGVSVARGEYLMFVDADDWLMDEALTDIVSACLDSEADLVWFDYARVYPSGTTRRNQRADVLQIANRLTSISDHPELLWIANLVTNKAYRRAFWEEQAIEFAAGYYEDIPISFETALKASSIRVLDRVCYAYRQRRKGSITSTVSRSHLDLITSFGAVFAMVSGHEAEEEVRPIVEAKYTRFIERMQTSVRHRIADRDYADFLDTARALYEEEIGESAPDHWAVDDGTPRPGRSVFRRRRPTPRDVELARRKGGVVYASSFDAHARTNLNAIRKTLDGPLVHVDLSADGVGSGDLALLGDARILVTDVPLPDSLELDTSTLVLDVGTYQSFSPQGVLAFERPAARPKPLNTQLRSSVQWDASLSQGSELLDTLGASYPGRYEKLGFGLPRNDALFDLPQWGGTVEQCMYAPGHRLWEHLPAISSLPRALAARGFRVVVHAPWLDPQLVPWDISRTDIRLGTHQELDADIVDSDALITDFSPIVFDYALSGRPILIDADGARDHMVFNAGPVSPLDELSSFRGLDDLVEILGSDKLGAAADRSALFASRYCNWDDGGSTARAVAWIEKNLGVQRNPPSLSTT